MGTVINEVGSAAGGVAKVEYKDEAGNVLWGFNDLGKPTGSLLMELKEHKSVTDFGVKGDGTTDDTVALNALFLNANQGDVIYFPHGTYKISDTLNFSGKEKNKNNLRWWNNFKQHKQQLQKYVKYSKL